MCGRMERSVVTKADVGESKVWLRVVYLLMVLVVRRMKQKGRPFGMIWMTDFRILE